MSIKDKFLEMAEAEWDDMISEFKGFGWEFEKRSERKKKWIELRAKELQEECVSRCPHCKGSGRKSNED